jgi:hypothetical protein
MGMAELMLQQQQQQQQQMEEDLQYQLQGKGNVMRREGRNGAVERKSSVIERLIREILWQCYKSHTVLACTVATVMQVMVMEPTTTQTTIVQTNNIIGKTNNVQCTLSNIYVLVLASCN